MATTITPSRDYLKKFAAPLWDLLDLEYCMPLSIIEGEREGYTFIIIDMRHDAFGLLGDDQSTAISTFFIVAHQKKITQPRISQPLLDFQVSADKQHVYLARPSKKVRPGEWEDTLKKAMNVADNLVEVSTTETNQKSFPATYRPVGAGAFVQAFWALVFLLFSILFLIVGLMGLFGSIKLDPSRSESIKLGLQCLLASPFAFGGAIYYYQRFKKRL